MNDAAPRDGRRDDAERRRRAQLGVGRGARTWSAPCRRSRASPARHQLVVVQAEVQQHRLLDPLVAPSTAPSPCPRRRGSGPLFEVGDHALDRLADLGRVRAASGWRGFPRPDRWCSAWFSWLMRGFCDRTTMRCAASTHSSVSGDQRHPDVAGVPGSRRALRARAGCRAAPSHVWRRTGPRANARIVCPRVGPARRPQVEAGVGHARTCRTGCEHRRRPPRTSRDTSSRFSRTCASSLHAAMLASLHRRLIALP